MSPTPKEVGVGSGVGFAVGVGAEIWVAVGVGTGVGVGVRVAVGETGVGVGAGTGVGVAVGVAVGETGVGVSVGLASSVARTLASTVASILGVGATSGGDAPEQPMAATNKAMPASLLSVHLMTIDRSLPVLPCRPGSPKLQKMRWGSGFPVPVLGELDSLVEGRSA